MLKKGFWKPFPNTFSYTNIYLKEKKRKEGVCVYMQIFNHILS